MDKDELSQPLWVQLPLTDYEALKRSGAPNLPEGHSYTAMVRSGGGGRTLAENGVWGGKGGCIQS